MHSMGASSHMVLAKASTLQLPLVLERQEERSCKVLHFIDMSRLTHRQDVYRDQFAYATPFKHMVFDDLLGADQLAQCETAFPSIDWDGWNNISHEHQYLKKSCDNIATIPEPLRTLIFELNSAPFVDWLSCVTGIPLLLPDPHLIGGGLHVSGPGGTLTPHTDFHVVEGLSLYRRLNLLLYLNRDWQAHNGGGLELWDKKNDKVEKTILPTLGTCVVFQTDNDSMHGFMTPVAHHDRQSVAIYYYTAEEAPQFSGDAGTHWRYESLYGDTQSVFALKTAAVFTLLSRVFSELSWRSSKIAAHLKKRSLVQGDTAPAKTRY